jgi:hypothetical protein
MSQLFYLRDSRSDVGNSCMFWAKDGAGYTTNLDKAHVYTLEEAQRHFNSRHTDVPLAKELVDELARVRVDHQCLKDDSSHKSAVAECVIRMGTRTDGNDVFWVTMLGHSANYHKASLFTYQEATEAINQMDGDSLRAEIYLRSDIDAIARRTFQASNINERKMITAAGIRKPKRPRTRRTTGKTRGNCPDCGKVTWGFNPHEAYSCADAMNESLGLDYCLYDDCEDVKRARSAA